MHRVESQGSSAAEAVTAGPGSAQVSTWVLALLGSVRYKQQWGLSILAVLWTWQPGACFHYYPGVIHIPTHKGCLQTAQVFSVLYVWLKVAQELDTLLSLIHVFMHLG